MKLLLDENLSPTIAAALALEGHDVCHVRDRGLLGATDPEVLDCAFDEDRILVTKNVADFEALAGRCELHAGVIFLEKGDSNREEQLEQVRTAICEVESQGDLVNQALRVLEEGRVVIEPMSKP